MSEDAEHAVDRWERDYRTAARADDYAAFRDHLRRLQLPDEPELMLQGTIGIVRQYAGYAVLDDRDEELDQFLELQVYELRDANPDVYCFTFDIRGKSYARILVETKVGTLDLADLYGSPWDEYRVVGFRCFWISHPDWREMDDDELRRLEGEVTDDLRFDYSEDELDFWFDSELDPGFLYVVVQDADECDE